MPNIFSIVINHAINPQCDCTSAERTGDVGILTDFCARTIAQLVRSAYSSNRQVQMAQTSNTTHANTSMFKIA